MSETNRIGSILSLKFGDEYGKPLDLRRFGVRNIYIDVNKSVIPVNMICFTPVNSTCSCISALTHIVYHLHLHLL